MTISFVAPADALKAAEKAAVAVFTRKDQPFEGVVADLDQQSGGSLERAVHLNRFQAGKGSAVDIVAPAGGAAERVILIGLGSDDLTELAQVESGASAYAATLPHNHETLVIIPEGGLDPVLVAEGAMIRQYRFDKYRTKEPQSKKPTVTNIVIAADDPASATTAFEVRKAVVEAMAFTRDLTSEPANVLHPESYADQLKALEAEGLKVTVLDEPTMEKLGMHALLGVGLGSRRASRLVAMEWHGGGEGEAPVALVGKGVTFDTGGISIKPSANMEDMKWDMGGSAIVSGVMKALANRKAKANVVGIVGLVENMPDGQAQRPGDIVTSASGQTIEILNTDAEGRLVLADALWYTVENYKPEWIIDLATLTGAMIVALGHEYAGTFTNSDELAEQVDAAGAVTGDKVWRFPLHDAYDKQINTPSADMKNIGGRGAGSITAAQFLKRFIGETPWMHIDVAGTVWSDKDLPLSEKGATGYGVRMLDRLIADTVEK